MQSPTVGNGCSPPSTSSRRGYCAYAQRLLGNCNVGTTSDESRDVVQFVFLRLCDQSPDQIGDRLAQWLYTVCRNRAGRIASQRAGEGEWKTRRVGYAHQGL